MRFTTLAALATAAVLACPSADAGSPGFDPRVITFGATRQRIQNTPIEQRPYRPLHFYGNTVRRRHHGVGPVAPRGQAQR